MEGGYGNRIPLGRRIAKREPPVYGLSPQAPPMNVFRVFLYPLAAVVVFLLAHCAPPVTPTADASGRPINPHPPGSLEHFRAEPNYPKTSNVWTNHDRLAQTHAGNSSLLFNLSTQRGYLMNGDEVVIDYPICTGTRSHPTPQGTFRIMEKIVDKKSNRYGKMYNAEGVVVDRDADAFNDPVPEGGSFVGAPMRYWMRLTSDGVGHHIGPVLRRPASHACVRGPAKTVPVVFSKVKVGTTVVIE
jgi:hypothetical protein